MTYEIRSRDYLDRARHRLDEDSREALFYAAFELRCGVESRLRQYLDAQDELSERKKRGWRVAQLAKDLESVFATGDRIAKVAIRKRSSSAILYEFYFTPVSSDLKKMAGQLGGYLHAPRVNRSADNSWWTETRAFLERVHAELKRANAGTMLGPPLRVPGTSRVYFSTEVGEGPGVEDVVRKLDAAETEIILEVTYLDTLPGQMF